MGDSVLMINLSLLPPTLLPSPSSLPSPPFIHSLTNSFSASYTLILLSTSFHPSHLLIQSSSCQKYLMNNCMILEIEIMLSWVTLSFMFLLHFTSTKHQFVSFLFLLFSFHKWSISFMGLTAIPITLFPQSPNCFSRISSLGKSI